MPDHEVVVVGAGMAGLTCAVELTGRGIGVVVLEASDAVGGRIRTDQVDGMRLDRGFQLLNPAYPALAGLVDLAALDLKAFGAGVVVASGGVRSVLADPRRSPLDVGGAFGSATGSLLEKARFASYLSTTALGTSHRVKARPDVAWGEALNAAGVSGRLRTSVLEPFLAGVLAEDSQQTSRVFVDLLLRTFARGTPSLPAGGMQALPQQVADTLPPGTVRLGERVTSVTGSGVDTEGGHVAATAVVVAADPLTAAELTGTPAPIMRGLTTYYHRAETSPASRPMLHVDGDRDGPILNTGVVSDVAPSYCRAGALVASTVLGAAHDEELAQVVRDQLARIYGVPTADWELVATYPIRAGLPAMLPPLNLRQPVDLGGGLYVAGDHRDTASIQGAIVSGRRAAAAVAGPLHG